MKLNQAGSFNKLMIPLVVFVLTSIGVGFLAFTSANSLSKERTDRDSLVVAEVDKVRKEIAAEEEAKRIDREKSPYTSYQSPEQLGSIELVYPKTWSAYVQEKENNTGLDGYFHPGFVRDTGSDTRVALRITVDTKKYAAEVEGYDKDIENGVLKSSPITISGSKGVKLVGEIDKDIKGSMIILPLREKTLKFWTESADYTSDFDNIIQENIVFVP